MVPAPLSHCEDSTSKYMRGASTGKYSKLAAFVIITICLLFISNGWLGVKAGPPERIHQPLSLAQSLGPEGQGLIGPVL